MSEDIDEQDTYHYDFTTASEWEIFIARLEEVIHEWKLPQLKYGWPLTKGQLETGEWEKKWEKLLYADSEFTLTRYSLKAPPSEDLTSPLDEELHDVRNHILEDATSIENDFLPPVCDNGYDVGKTPSMLVRWYGLRDFMVLSPVRGQTISQESKVKMLLSSIFIAINNSYCPVPILVQVHEPKQMYFLGGCESKGVRTDFEMVHLRRTPSHCKYLTGLLNLFKSKIASPISLEPITVAVRFTYVLQDWTSSAWTSDLEPARPEDVAERLGRLPFGAEYDPISELHLYATWPRLVENAVVDSESYSDLDPSQAPLWSLRLLMAERPSCLLGDHLAEFLRLSESGRTMRDLLGDLVVKQGTDMTSSLSLLTDSRVPTISKVIGRAKKSQKRKCEGPIGEELLMPLLYYMFPDAEKDSKNVYPEGTGDGDCIRSPIDTSTSGLKSVERDSLIWRLAVLMSHVVHTLGGVSAAAHLWYEFAQEMRFRWEKAIPVPGVQPGFPDPRTCLLHQKLQMLNCCVARKNARDQEQLARAASIDMADSDSDSDSDQFFDCSDDEEPSAATATRKKHKHSLWNQPVGRLRRHGNLRLVTTGDHLYVPVTQEATPKTEDQVEEDAEVLLQLGTDPHGSELRARMMSASLLSDMESFKAANPGAVLDDFIRWYSPRDWIEAEGHDQHGQRAGSLSARMQIQGNTWQEVWHQAKPVPARRQKRLFDDTREAEKVLHYLESRQPRHFAQLLLPTLTHAAVQRLMRECAEELPSLTAQLQVIVKTVERLTRGPAALQRYKDLAVDIVNVETTLSQYKSLEHKFSSPAGPMESQILVDMMTRSEVEVPGGMRGHIRSKVASMFAEAQKVADMITDSEPLGPNEEPWSTGRTSFPRPMSREFLMRVSASRPAPSSAQLPQRLYATLKKEEFRLAGAFSHATNFQ